MNDSNESTNFFDRRTLGALVLVFAVWMGWQHYMQTKYPHLYQKKTQEENQPVAKNPSEAPALQAAEASKGATQLNVKPGVSAPVASQEKLIDYRSDNFSFQITSKGMGFKDLKLLKYTTRNGEAVEFSMPQSPYSLETRLLGSSEPVDFAIEKVSDNVWAGHATVGTLTVMKTITVDPEKYTFDVKVNVQGQDPKFLGLTTYLSFEVEPHKSGGFFSANQYERQEAFVDTQESHNNHVLFQSDVIDQHWAKAQVVSLGSQYFTQAVVDHSNVLPEVKLHMDPNAKSALMQIQHSVLNKGDNFEIQYLAFVGPKSYSLLKSIDENLVPVINLGFFATIARFILVLLKGFQGLVGNWGVAIILLTICVRLVVLPFNIMSYRSMKAMQVLQPRMAAIREKYKDDQQRQNQEIMSLLREHKVNPLGGCLPVLLQLPIFWALYQVLGQAIELYQAPFVLWIHDLSLKDPFYVLPVLMGGTMFLQQKITPNTMDPAQAKVLMMMPIVFSFFMLSLPSGLTLYIWISALFAVIQQYYFMKSHNPLVERK